MLKKILTLFISILIFFIILEILLRLFSFFYFFEIEQVNKNKLKDKNEIRILCLGESTTAGTFSNAYPRMLEEILISKGKRVKVINKGIHKTNSTFILEKVPEYIKEYNPQIVVAMMGINDDDRIQYYEEVREKESFIFKNIKSYQYLRSLINVIWIKLSLNKNKIKNIDEILNQAKKNRNKGYYKEAEKLYKKAVMLQKNNIMVYFVWLTMYLDMNDEAKSKALSKEMLKLFSHDYRLYIHFSNYYKDSGDYNKANYFLKIAMKLNPNNKSVNFLIADIYYRQGYLDKAEKIYLETIELSNDFKRWAYIGLGMISKDRNEEEKATEYFKKAEELSNEAEKIELRKVLGRDNYNQEMLEITKINYIKLSELLNKKGIKLICVQYPMRKINSLKETFNNTKGIYFVDNAFVFKKAIEKIGYGGIFIDMFAGDFGHCTIKGNILLSENIAEVILKEVVYDN